MMTFAGRKNWLARISLDERKAEIVKVEEQSLDATGLRSDVIPLYAGGQYWLYRYTKYADVRLVFAPENQIGFFRGDPHNFTHARYDIEFALCRANESGAPAARDRASGASQTPAGRGRGSRRSLSAVRNGRAWSAGRLHGLHSPRVRRKRASRPA